MGDEFTGPHQRGNVTALGARQVKIPNAHRAVAATNNGEQVCVQGAHGAHCRPPAEWSQPDRRHPVDNRRIRQPVASRTHRSVTDVLTQNCHPRPETQHPKTSHPGSQSMVSKLETKEPNHFSPSDTNREIMRFPLARPGLTEAFSADLDTPHRPRVLCTSGTTWEAVRRRHRCPRSPGSERDAPPHPADLPFSRTVIVLSGWPDIERPGGWIVWAITLRQPGPMSTDTSPLHHSHPPSQQVRPASPTQSRDPGHMRPPGSWRWHRRPACRVSGPGSAGRRWRRPSPSSPGPKPEHPRLSSPSLPTPHRGAPSSPPAS